MVQNRQKVKVRKELKKRKGEKGINPGWVKGRTGGTFVPDVKNSPALFPEMRMRRAYKVENEIYLFLRHQHSAFFGQLAQEQEFVFLAALQVLFLRIILLLFGRNKSDDYFSQLK